MGALAILSKSVPLTILWLAIPVEPGTARADPTLTILHSFELVPDGAGPTNGLVQDESGALYSVTLFGGDSGGGTVFKLTPPTTTGGVWTESVLHSFTGTPDGSVPASELVFAESGDRGDDPLFHRALYGTTAAGGVGTCDFGGARGCGTVFKLTPPKTNGGAWTESVLHSFVGTDGESPRGALIFDQSEDPENIVNDSEGPLSHLFRRARVFPRALYGTTYAGGDYNAGTVFKLTPPTTVGAPWTESVLHSFSGTDGAGPSDGLIFDKFGALCGTTAGGGDAMIGTVFKLTPPATRGGAWTESVLHSFAGSDGAGPLGGLIFDEAGALYGTTAGGGDAMSCSFCGTVFKLTPPTAAGGAWTESVLHSFAGAAV